MKKSLFLFFALFLSISFVKSQALDFGVQDNSTSFGAEELYSYIGELRVLGGTFDSDDKILMDRYEWIEVLLPSYEGIVDISWKFYGWEPYVKYYEPARPGAAPKSSVALYVPGTAKPQTTIVATVLYNDSRSYVDYVRTFYLMREE